MTASTTPSRETDVLRRLGELRVLPLATIPPSDVQAIGHTLVREALPCIEIALRTSDAIEAIARASQVDGLLVGAGTVLTQQQARAVASAGAAFAVAPGLNEDMVECCREIGLPFFPGVATPTEMERARRLGVRTLKVFPITSLGGVAFLRALSAIYPDVRFIPTGGINLTNLGEYLAVPNVLACGGSWLINQPDGGALDELAFMIHQTREIAR